MMLLVHVLLVVSTLRSSMMHLATAIITTSVVLIVSIVLIFVT